MGRVVTLIVVELKMIPGEAEAARKFIAGKLQNQITIHKGRIEVADERAVDVKMLLQKFLHKEGLDGYRVLSEGGVVTVEPDNRDVHHHEESHEDKVKGVPPFPPLSRERLPLMDLVYPNYTSRGYGYKKKKR